MQRSRSRKHQYRGRKESHPKGKRGRTQHKSKHTLRASRLGRSPRPRRIKRFRLEDAANPNTMRKIMPYHTYIQGRGFVPDTMLHLERVINPPLSMPPGCIRWQPPKPQTPGW